LRGARKDPFVAGKDVGEKTVVAGLAFEELGGEFGGGAATAVKEDDGVRVGCGWVDDVGVDVRHRVEDEMRRDILSRQMLSDVAVARER
jgi:hypothetical protein